MASRYRWDSQPVHSGACDGAQVALTEPPTSYQPLWILETCARIASGRRRAVEIIGVLIAGIVLGLLGKWVAPGDKDNTPLWLTTLCGIVGALIGWIIYLAFGGNGSPGLDWTCWILVVLCAASLVAIVSNLTGRKKVNLPR
jgi:uncharacterized membrane protein YeaQ/YmgE (transglycosylase-associated protein family)